MSGVEMSSSCLRHCEQIHPMSVGLQWNFDTRRQDRRYRQALPAHVFESQAPSVQRRNPPAASRFFNDDRQWI